MKKIWKHSRIRFYILNFITNLKFWILCKKLYKEVGYHKKDYSRIITGHDMKMKYPSDYVTRKRFEGYLYKNSIYLDNPGITNIDRDTWKAWKRKGLLKRYNLD